MDSRRTCEIKWRRKWTLLGVDLLKWCWIDIMTRLFNQIDWLRLNHVMMNEKWIITETDGLKIENKISRYEKIGQHNDTNANRVTEQILRQKVKPRVWTVNPFPLHLLKYGEKQFNFTWLKRTSKIIDLIRPDKWIKTN